MTLINADLIRVHLRVSAALLNLAACGGVEGEGAAADE